MCLLQSDPSFLYFKIINIWCDKSAFGWNNQGCNSKNIQEEKSHITTSSWQDQGLNSYYSAACLSKMLLFLLFHQNRYFCFNHWVFVKIGTQIGYNSSEVCAKEFRSASLPWNKSRQNSYRSNIARNPLHKKSFSTNLGSIKNNMCTNLQTKWMEWSIDISEIV